ncbi:MAG: DNA polymerase Y family protein [Halioglobus sp.]|nr:DNA polymerase Y family protein [Halioglobus sp.]
MSLWLCLRFDQLPLQCLSHCEQQPVVVLAAQRVLHANDFATATGIRQGMGTATVRALAGDEPVRLLERNEQAEQHCLQQLCCWAYSITPTLCTWQADCLQLEISGCLSLFQGLDMLLQEVTSGIGSRGYRARYGLAPTPKAAWLLSFAAPDTAMAIQQPLEDRLSPLPLNLLTQFATTVDSLRRAGLHTLGDLLRLPPVALGRRCGREFTHFLQQLLGQREDLQVDYRPPETFSDTYWFGYEVKTNDELMPAVQRLLQSLCRFLRNTQLRTSEITWQLAGMDNKLQDLCVRSTSSHSNWENWYQLSRMRFERLQLSGGVEGLALACQQLQPGQQESIDLFSPRNQREPLASLLDRLHNRLGLQAVEKVGCRDEHLPEFALLVSSDHTGDQHTNTTHCAQRPFWLMPQPKALRQHGTQLYWNGALKLLYGPERIEDNWWQEATSRDYYIAAGSDGQHYWVFHDRLARQWYIHGVFA